MNANYQKNSINQQEYSMYESELALLRKLLKDYYL